MARSGAGAGESSAVREASRGIEASDDAYPCPLCAKASGVTAVTGTRPCCACPGQRIASRRQDPGSHARWPRSWTRSGPPAPSGGSGPSIPPSSAPRPSPCAELWAGGPWGPPQDRPRKLTLAVFLFFGLFGKRQSCEPKSSLFWTKWNLQSTWSHWKADKWLKRSNLITVRSSILPQS
jgi:hypothetical protein